MKRHQQLLLIVDAIVNLAIGILLLLVPLGTAELFGVPRSNLDFYPTLLGAVIFGIGIALLIEIIGYAQNIRGLGLGGAITINFCAATVLMLWLLIGSPNLPVRGLVLLWAIVILVFGIGIAELITKSWQYE
jgi:hypothetical protein